MLQEGERTRWQRKFKINNFKGKKKNNKSAFICGLYLRSHTLLNDWIINYGCMNHMCFENKNFENFHKYKNDAIVIGDNSILEFQGIGVIA